MRSPGRRDCGETGALGPREIPERQRERIAERKVVMGFVRPFDTVPRPGSQQASVRVSQRSCQMLWK
jgi:hypothetical protein